MPGKTWREPSRRLRASVAVTVILASVVVLTAGAVLAESDGAAKFGCYCIGTVGNVNCDYRDEITLGDVSLLIDHLFITFVRLPNLQEANINGDPEGEISIGDVSLLVDHLFITGPSLVLPDCPTPYNTPPQTQIVGFVEGIPFVNGIEPPWSPEMGVPMDWQATDIVDHPSEDPDFEYEYRMYGPYTDSLYDIVSDSFLVPIFCLNDGRIFRFGEDPPAFFVVCDTTWLPGGTREIRCDTILIDALVASNVYGTLDTLFDFEHPDFESNPNLNRLAVISGDGGDSWITAVSDTLYNVYADYPSDTTLIMNFLFTVRARETLAPEVVDPTPAFVKLSVIDPSYERDILVLNWSSTSHENGALHDSAVVFWDQAIASWAASSGLGDVIHFDYERDIILDVTPYGQNNRMLDLALKYKTIINVQDAAVSGVWSGSGEAVQNICVAMQAGVNVWTAARVPLGNHGLGAGSANDWASELYAYSFGVHDYHFPGWSSPHSNPSDGYGYGLPRLEDFVGATPQSSDWPELTVDTAALRGRYDWAGCIPEPGEQPYPCFPFYPFLSDPGALPQVGWCVRTFDTEALYTYVSSYGAGEHPFVPGRDYHGKPVMHRLDRGLFRSVHSVFTPMALEATCGQRLINSVLGWLYERWLPAHTSDKSTDIVGASNDRSVN